MASPRGGAPLEDTPPVSDRPAAADLTLANLRAAGLNPGEQMAACSHPARQHVRTKHWHFHYQGGA